MKRVIIFIFFLSATAYFSSCTQKMICPAYHSYFILDVEETRKTFTLFGADSLPRKNWEIDREKYGIAKEISEEEKLKEMRIISMNSIYKKIEDPFEMFQHEYAESDSIYNIDSAAILAQSNYDNDFQNVDQMIYLHHFGKYLPGKRGSGDEFAEDMKQEEEPLVSDVDLEDGQPPKKKRKFWPFGKKNKTSKDDTSEDSGEEEE